MPSYLDVDDSMDGLQEDDLVPLSSRLSATPLEYSSDSDSEIKNMKFKPSHFNPDTSSEEDASFSRDLKFTDDAPDAAATPGVFSNLAKIGGELMANVMRTAKRKSESDSDFEIIDSEEFDERN